MFKRTIITDLVQGMILGAVLAVATAYLLVKAEIKAMHTTSNGWTTTLKYGAFGSDILLRAATAKDALAANVAEEAVYWTAAEDDAGRTLNGQHN